VLQNAGVLLLASTSMIVLWLSFATVRGLREGSLLAPEPVANIIPVSA
jgi:tellurite resistance protein